jgi:hypothetical protein
LKQNRTFLFTKRGGYIWMKRGSVKRDGGKGDSRLKKANSCLSCPLSHFALYSTLSPFPLSSCSQLHPPLQSAVTSKAELYGLCVRTIEVSGEAEILLNASQHTWRNYASPAGTWSTSRLLLIQISDHLRNTVSGLCYFIVTVYLKTLSVAQKIRSVEW